MPEDFPSFRSSRILLEDLHPENKISPGDLLYAGFRFYHGKFQLDGYKVHIFLPSNKRDHGMAYIFVDDWFTCKWKNDATVFIHLCNFICIHKRTLQAIVACAAASVLTV